MNEDNSLVSKLRADITMTRSDRIAVGLSLQEDGFTSRDIVRVVSVRKQTVLKMREALGLPARRLGWSPYNSQRSNAVAPPSRSLEAIARAIAHVPLDDLGALCEKLRIGIISGFGLRRAIDYSMRVSTNPVRATFFRCANDDCQQITPTHPCSHCGASWLKDAA